MPVVFAQQFPLTRTLARRQRCLPWCGGKRLSAGYVHCCMPAPAPCRPRPARQQDRLQWFTTCTCSPPRWTARSSKDAFAGTGKAKGHGRDLSLTRCSACMLRLHTQIPAQAMQVLDNARGQHELSAPLLTAAVLRSVMIDFRALPTWRARRQTAA